MGWKLLRLTFYCFMILFIYEVGAILVWMFWAITGTSFREVHNMAWQSDLAYLIWIFVLIIFARGIIHIFQGKS